jgi:hypothetical protein
MDKQNRPVYHDSMPKLIRNSLEATALLLAITCMIASYASAQTPAGSIKSLSGTVSIQRAGKPIPAIIGTALQVGDKLTTGPNSSVTVVLSDGSEVELNESGILVLTENILNPDGSRASTKVTLLDGLVRSLVKVAPGHPPNFEVHTPNAVASARGTMFEVAYHKNQAPPALP